MRSIGLILLLSGFSVIAQSMENQAIAQVAGPTIVPTTIQSGITKETRFPHIRPDCKTDFQVRQPIFLGSRSGSVTVSGRQQSPEEEQMIRESLSVLSEAKQWDAALVEIEKIPVGRFRDTVSLELIKSMSQAKETDRALLLLFQFFPGKLSNERASGIGIIAKGMVRNDRFPQALETFKLLLDSNEWNISTETASVIGVILQPTTTVQTESATSKQLQEVRSVLDLFPSDRQQKSIWRSIGELPIAPNVVKQIAELSPNADIKLSLLEDVSTRLFNFFYRDSYANEETRLFNFFYGNSYVNEERRLKHGREVANSVDNCVVRSKVFLELADRVVWDGYFSRQFTVSAKFRMLDQLEALIDTIDLDRVGDRSVVLSQRLRLLKLNAEMGRNSRSSALLNQVMNEQEKFQFNADRAEFLLKVVEHREELNRSQTAIEILEAAEVAAQMAYLKNEDAFSGKSSRSNSNVEAWRDQIFDRIVSRYEKLNQPEKVTRLQRSRCTPLSSKSLARIQPLISAGAISPSVLKVPGFLCPPAVNPGLQ